MEREGEGELASEDDVGSSCVGSSDGLRFSCGLGLSRLGYMAACPNIFVWVVVSPVPNGSFGSAAHGSARYWGPSFSLNKYKNIYEKRKWRPSKLKNEAGLGNQPRQLRDVIMLR